MRNYSLKIYKKLTPEIFSKWEQLWSKSENANIWNSPFWLDAYLSTYGSKDHVIAFFSDNGENKIICPLVKTKRYGVKIYESPYPGILDKSSILFIGNDYIIFEGFFNKIAKLGTILTPEFNYDIALANKTNKFCMKLSSSISYFLPLYGDPLRFIKKRRLKKPIKLIDKLQDKLTYVHRSGKDLSEIDIAYEISKFSYKKRVKGYKDPFADKKMRTFLDNLVIKEPAMISLDMLLYENKPIAFYLGYLHKKKYWAFQTAYLPGYKAIKPGIILNLFLIKRLHRENYKFFDFGRGGGRYKSEITPLYRTQYNVLITKNPIVRFWFKFINFILNTVRKYNGLYNFFCIIRKCIGQIVFYNIRFSKAV